ncbi:MAG: hypothetical protein WB770_11140 [Acidimicrobiales bacterium]
MTSELDHANSHVSMLRCELGSTSLYSSLVLAVQDMRTANGRDEVTGDGSGNDSWIGLTLGMTVLDSMTPDHGHVGKRLTGLLVGHGISGEDAKIVVELRHSLLHGYGLPKPHAVGGRTVYLIPDTDCYAVDSSTPGFALVSVPVFCSRLVERIVSESPDSWDTTLIDTRAVRPTPGAFTVKIDGANPVAGYGSSGSVSAQP